MLPCLSYVAQFIPPSGSVLRADRAALTVILHLPANLFPPPAARLHDFGGPRIPDLGTQAEAARLCAAYRTLTSAAAFRAQLDEVRYHDGPLVLRAARSPPPPPGLKSLALVDEIGATRCSDAAGVIAADQRHGAPQREWCRALAARAGPGEVQSQYCEFGRLAFARALSSARWPLVHAVLGHRPHGSGSLSRAAGLVAGTGASYAETPRPSDDSVRLCLVGLRHQTLDGHVAAWIENVANANDALPRKVVAAG